MSLAVLDWSLARPDFPPEVESLLEVSQQRVELMLQADEEEPVFSFVPSDFRLAYQALGGVFEQRLATGKQLLEWGSGLGIVAILASQLGWQAIGIEAEQNLVNVAVELATSHQSDAQFFCGSYVPEGAERFVEQQADINWLRTDVLPSYEEVGMEVDDFDLVYCYPWPGEEELIFQLFDRYASVGALLLTYHGQEGMQLRRKVGSRRK